MTLGRPLLGRDRQETGYSVGEKKFPAQLGKTASSEQCHTGRRGNEMSEPEGACAEKALGSFYLYVICKQ